MKPKYRHFLRAAFPSLIILPAMVTISSAVPIPPDGFGDVLVTSSNSGANNIVVAPGQPAAFSPFEIRFDPNASLTPSGFTAIDIQDPAAIYALNMGAGSSIDGGPNIGINSRAANLTVNNSNSISGGDDAIRFTATGTGTVNNPFGALIDGTTGANSDGIQGTATFTVNNNGTIRGNNDGIRAVAGAIINNNTNFTMGIPTSGGSIIGINDEGIEAGDGLFLVNQNLATITGSGNGIVSGNGANITNDLGGSITGAFMGINAGDGLILNNSGMITGQGNDAVFADRGATIVNSGTLTGTGLGGDGIELGGNGSVTNTGSIIGADDGIDLLGAGGDTFALINSGLIQGGNFAVEGDASDDTLTLNLGSRLIGGVAGGGGTDTIAFGTSLSSAGGTGNSISGTIVDIDNITKTGGGVALIGLPGEALNAVNADNITVTSGGLYINGNIASANGGGQANFVSNGVAIGGTGLWNANVNIKTGGISAGAIPINLDVVPPTPSASQRYRQVTHQAGSFIRFDVRSEPARLTTA